MYIIIFSHKDVIPGKTTNNNTKRYSTNNIRQFLQVLVSASLLCFIIIEIKEINIQEIIRDINSSPFPFRKNDSNTILINRLNTSIDITLVIFLLIFKS